MGCPTWEDLRCVSQALSSAANLTFWLMSDAGGEQVLSKTTITALLEDFPDVWVFSLDCLVHQGQLIIQYELAMVDQYVLAAGVKWKLYGSLAKFANITRENAKD